MTDLTTINAKQSAASHLTALLDAAAMTLGSHVAAAEAGIGTGSDDFTAAGSNLLAAAKAFLAGCDANGATIRVGYRG